MDEWTPNVARKGPYQASVCELGVKMCWPFLDIQTIKLKLKTTHLVIVEGWQVEIYHSYTFFYLYNLKNKKHLKGKKDSWSFLCKQP